MTDNHFQWIDERRDHLYGWVIVGACFCLTFTLGETFWTFGVFLKPLQQEFGWSRAMVSSIFTAFLVGYAVSVIASLNFLIESVGWRATFLMLGILFGLIVGVATLLLRPPPRLMEVTGKSSAENGLPGASAEPRSYAAWAFVAVIFSVVVGVFTFQIISTHLVAHATDVGISPAAAAAALGLMGGFSIPGRLLSGLLSARLGWSRLL